MVLTTVAPEISWEKLPEDYILPDDPVDNINQPALASALSEILSFEGLTGENPFTCTNYGIVAKFKGKFAVKAPDWAYIPRITVPREEIERSYTPNLQGDIPVIVMEFLSYTEGDEYSIKPTYPPGKWFFYEQILKVPNYVIFEPKSAEIEFYRLDDNGSYQIQLPTANKRYWIAEMNLFLGVWQGTRLTRSGNWLRWWDATGNLILWDSELAQIAQKQAQIAQQQAQTEAEKAKRLAEKLKSLGINPDEV